MTFHIYCGRRLRHLVGATVPVADYIDAQRRRFGSAVADAESRQYQRALNAVHRHPWWDPARRALPAVGWDPEHDAIYYVFPLAREGLTFFVSRQPVPALERWARQPKLFHDQTVVEV